MPCKVFSPDEVIAAMLQALDNVLLISLCTDHDDGHHSIWHCLAQLYAELLACKHRLAPGDSGVGSRAQHVPSWSEWCWVCLQALCMTAETGFWVEGAMSRLAGNRIHVIASPTPALVALQGLVTTQADSAPAIHRRALLPAVLGRT